MLESMKKLEELSQKRVEELLKAKKEGVKIVGYTCAYTPPEIIYALGAIPIRLFRGGEQDPALLAEDYTRSTYCPFVKACLGYHIEGKDPFYTLLDQIWVVYSCDMMRMANEIWYKYLNLPAYIMNIPRIYQRESALELFITELEEGTRKLEQLTGQKLDQERLFDAIAAYNETRKLLKRIYETRKEKNPPIKGKDALKLVHYSFYLDPKKFNSALKGVIEEAEDKVRKGIGEYDGSPLRIMLSGSIVAQGDEKLVNLIENEEARAAIVTEDVCTGTRNFHDLVDFHSASSLLESIAQSYLMKTPCARMRPSIKRYEFMKELARDFQVEGVIFYTLKFCFNYRTETFRVIKEMEEIGVPVLHIESDYSHADIGQLSTRVAAFMEVLEERR